MISLASRIIRTPAVCANKFQFRGLASAAPLAKIDHIKRVGVIGSGQMGLGIAYVAANVTRLPVVLMDINKEQTDKGIQFMNRLLEKDITKSKITAEHAQETRELVSTANSLNALSDVDYIIEAASENLDIKKAIFRDLDSICKPDAILATNTSSISITKIAAATKRAEQVIGMHFMNPVPVMKLVEIIPGLATSPEVLETTRSLATSMGKTCTVVKDIPGFVANRLLMPYINEALMLLESEFASAEDIDTTMKLGTNMPMGPLTLADFIGLDTCLAIMKVLHENTGDSKYRPAVLLQKYVDAGWLGRKNGRGVDLDVVFEESEATQAGTSYLDQVLDPTLPISLSFLRAKTATALPTPAAYQQTSREIMNSGDNGGSARRARAGTMPSLVNIPEKIPRRSPFLQPVRDPGRHRSGSLNLPSSQPMQLGFDNSVFGRSWNVGEDNAQRTPSTFASPSMEQLYRVDSDLSIARTLRSLGLEDEDETLVGSSDNSVSEFHMISRPLLSVNRSRSYTVNGTTRYHEPSTTTRRSRTTSMTKAYAPFEGFSTRQSRPRASSMGRMDYPHTSSLWSTQRMPLAPLNDDDDGDDDYSVRNTQSRTTPLSLGDSELLANMFAERTINENLALNGSINENNKEEPCLQPSQSTPTLHSYSSSLPHSGGSPTQTATRSLWIGNIDASVSVEALTKMFSAFGPIESVRLLLEKECAFVNFFHLEDAVRAKEEVLGHLGGRMGACIVRVGFGRADAAAPETITIQPTRALWLGNVPSGINPSKIRQIFSPYGVIESVRVLPHKSCGFVNFELVESAVAARDALVRNDIATQGLAGVRAGFAKVPPTKTPQTSSAGLKTRGDKDEENEDENSWLDNIWETMQQLDVDDHAHDIIQLFKASTSSYCESISPVPEAGVDGTVDVGRLREIRKKLDNANIKPSEVDNIAYEYLEQIAVLSSDYIGNTVVQRLFEKCTEELKTRMLKIVAPHLAALSVHKNGTWAAQKIIDTAKTPEQPYVPPLLLDQFGNYAVQCCLRLGETNNQFIFNAMVEKLQTIAQGRFGARAIRGTLENQYTTPTQQKFIAACFLQNFDFLSTNANGVLLLSWLIDAPILQGRLHMVASRLLPRLPQIAVHKLGSQIAYKLVSQNLDKQAQQVILDGLMNQCKLEEILLEPVRGVSFIQKVLHSSHVSAADKSQLASKVRPLLSDMLGTSYKTLLAEIVAMEKKPQN
ncbi:hypothetical protein DFQ30_005229 [Apophysomyces sp. BC1015]|nr:hypothetical protein DFQ30_005229 [Apophysomyces sp. BC1015]KAG0183396.1 hypothetical protein DFQ29_005772 [Apophysomyces sp. BC1021]